MPLIIIIIGIIGVILFSLFMIHIIKIIVKLIQEEKSHNPIVVTCIKVEESYEENIIPSFDQKQRQMNKKYGMQLIGNFNLVYDMSSSVEFF